MVSFLALPPWGAWGEITRNIEEPHRSSPTPVAKAPLRQLIEQVASEAGVVVRGHDVVDIEVPIPPPGLPARARLQKLLAHVDHVLVEEMTPDGDLKPAFVVIVSRGDGRSPLTTEVAVPPSDAPSAPNQPASLVETLLDDPNRHLRRWAIERLGERGDEAAFPWLVRALDDNDSGVREAALDTLGQYGARAVELVVSRLRREPVAQVRVAAVELLGQVGGVGAVDILAGMAEERDIEVGIAAVEALGRISHPAATQVLLMLARNQQPAVRRAALETLALFAPETIAETAVQQALADRDETVNALAADLTETTQDRQRTAPAPAQSE
jgi:hypothetical protein